MDEYELNIPLARKGLEWIEGEAQKPKLVRAWYQGAWRALGSERARVCGTTHCFAGYIDEISGGVWASEDPNDGWFDELVATADEIADGVCRRFSDSKFPGPGFHTVTAGTRAQRLLGISESTANLLFSPDTYPSEMRRILERVAGEPL